MDLLEFERWEPEVEDAIRAWASHLRQWRWAERAITQGGLGPFAKVEGSIDTAIAAMKAWVTSAVMKCETIAELGASDYDRLVFSVTEARRITLMPMMEGGPTDDRQRYTEVAAYIVRTTSDGYAFYGSNNASWQEWIDREKSWIDDESAGPHSLDQVGRFETEGRLGATYYVEE